MRIRSFNIYVSISFAFVELFHINTDGFDLTKLATPTTATVDSRIYEKTFANLWCHIALGLFPDLQILVQWQYHMDIVEEFLELTKTATTSALRDTVK